MIRSCPHDPDFIPGLNNLVHKTNKKQRQREVMHHNSLLGKLSAIIPTLTKKNL
jgi:hypothetical protein